MNGCLEAPITERSPNYGTNPDYGTNWAGLFDSEDVQQHKQ